MPAKQFPNDHPTSDDGQVSRKTALPAESAENGKIIFDEGQEALGRQVLFVLMTQLDRASAGRVPDHVDDQTHEAIHEVFPRVGLLLDTTL
jgi:hypothetical protein